jgi:hypothetical protein
MLNIMFAIWKDINGAAVRVCAWKIMSKAKRGSKRQPHLGEIASTKCKLAFSPKPTFSASLHYLEP